MTRIPISLPNLPFDLQRLRGELRQAAGRGIRNGVRRGRTLLVSRTPKDNGLMKAAWKDNTHRAETATGGVAAEIFNDAPYAGIVEAGARPHPVSLEGKRAILEWVKRHMTVQGPMPSRRKGDTALRNLAIDTDDQLYMGIVNAIVWKLRTKGQRPTYFVRDSRQEILDGIRAEVMRAMEKVSREHRP